jgi:uncharacterized circularly permuted ATP-grasp superfamily protein
MNSENAGWSVAANSAAATPPWFTPIPVESPLGMTTEQRMTMRQSSSQNGSMEAAQSISAPGDELSLDSYDTGGFYDELFNDRSRPRAEARALLRRIRSLGRVELLKTQAMVERTLLRMGITFNVYSDGRGAERIFPFDILPRIVAAKEWNTIERGLQQRTKALNMFINDCYHKQEILNEGIVPRYLVDGAASFREPCRGLKPPQGIWCHITGTDLVRDGDGRIYVLEDNLRCPSGVSYVLQNRAVMKRHFPRVFEASHVRPVQDYPSRLLSVLERLSPSDVERPRVVLLTPGVYNSAYYEHSFLAQQMGIELVEGRDLVVKDHTVYMRTTTGFERVDVIYRRIDDDFIDPTVFRKDSMLGVPGIVEAYRRGRVALANAPGTGIADDKVIYAYVEKMIKYYLNEDAILPNVPTYVCQDDEERKYVLANLDKLVVKAANESGGYGMLVGPHATEEDRKEFAKRVAENPRNYIAQPTLRLSRVPTIVNGEIEGRHVDLRPYILYGEDIFVLPGGLTRVALRKGSLVVNSSQGGGSKDTWVISSDGAEAADTAE